MSFIAFILLLILCDYQRVMFRPNAKSSIPRALLYFAVSFFFFAIIVAVAAVLVVFVIVTALLAVFTDLSDFTALLDTLPVQIVLKLFQGAFGNVPSLLRLSPTSSGSMRSPSACGQFPMRNVPGPVDKGLDAQVPSPSRTSCEPPDMPGMAASSALAPPGMSPVHSLPPSPSLLASSLAVSPPQAPPPSLTSTPLLISTPPPQASEAGVYDTYSQHIEWEWLASQAQLSQLGRLDTQASAVGSLEDYWMIHSWEKITRQRALDDDFFSVLEQVSRPASSNLASSYSAEIEENSISFPRLAPSPLAAGDYGSPVAPEIGEYLALNGMPQPRYQSDSVVSSDYDIGHLPFAPLPQSTQQGAQPFPSLDEVPYEPVGGNTHSSALSLRDMNSPNCPQTDWRARCAPPIFKPMSIASLVYPSSDEHTKWPAMASSTLGKVLAPGCAPVKSPSLARPASLQAKARRERWRRPKPIEEWI